MHKLQRGGYSVNISGPGEKCVYKENEYQPLSHPTQKLIHDNPIVKNHKTFRQKIDMGVGRFS